MSTQPTIKVIQTLYHGCHFRSRTEARWAVFFDTLGIKWEYEKEGYVLPAFYSTCNCCGEAKRHVECGYLPDFWFPATGRFIEVKGDNPSIEEEFKVLRLALLCKCVAHIVHGIPDFDTRYASYAQTDELVVGFASFVSSLESLFRFDVENKIDRTREALLTAVTAARMERFEVCNR